jgi:hypothetical protein
MAMNVRTGARPGWRLLLGALLALFVTAGGASAANPVSGFVVGQVTAVKKAGFVVKSSFGSVGNSTVTLASGSSIVEQVTATRADLKPGICVVANGQRSSSGAVEASRLTLSTPVKGSCSGGFPGRGAGRGPGRTGAPPAGGAPPAAAGTRPSYAGGGFGNFGFASGVLDAVHGSTLSLRGTTGSSTVTLSSTTQLLTSEKVSATAIKLDACVRVAGTSSDGGATIAATSVNLSAPASSGCGGGFPGRP